MPYPKSPHLFDVVKDKPLVWLHGEVKTPPWSLAARREAGYLLRRLQLGDRLSLPASRPIPCIGPAVHELRIKDQSAEWRIVYRMDADAPLRCYSASTGATGPAAGFRKSAAPPASPPSAPTACAAYSPRSACKPAPFRTSSPPR